MSSEPTDARAVSPVGATLSPPPGSPPNNPPDDNPTDDAAPTDTAADAVLANGTADTTPPSADGTANGTSNGTSNGIAHATPPAHDTAPATTAPALATEPRIPPQKDASLRTFLSKMDADYTPLIPDAVTDYYLTVAGLPPPPHTDRRLARLLALATQKFVADVAADAYQYARIRSSHTTSNHPMAGLGGGAGFAATAGAGTAEAGDAAGGKGGAAATRKEGGRAAGALGGPRPGYGGGGAGTAAQQGRTVLTMEDLGMAVGEYGVNVKRGEYYR